MNILKEMLSEKDIDITEKQLYQFEKYMEGILSYNEHINLTAIRDRDEFIKKHFIDSLLGGLNKEFAGSSRICDIGTGAGFPGVPLAILFPEKEFILIDSLNKRLKIVQQLCDELGISNVTVHHSRAEDAGRNRDFREKFDVCISRAVADLRVLSELCLPLVRKGGYFLSYKGPECDDELDGAKKAIAVLGGRVNKVVLTESPFADFNHNIIFIEKVKPVPAQYPRKAGIPSKNPIS